MIKMDRKGLAVKSSIIGLTSKLFVSLLAFVCRKVFLEYLGAELLGINSTLTQVLDTLSLTELGFQTTIIFQLYRPIVENKHDEVSKIIMFLKRVYSIIGIVILVLGTVLAPFLKYIITKVYIDFVQIYIVYFVMLFGTASSYLFSYNRALLQADQKVYINNLFDVLFQIITTIAKIACLIVFKNFVLYAVIGVINTISSNIASYVYCKKYYFWIDKKAKANRKIIEELVNNTKDVFIGKIGGYIYSSTDNLVISAFVGTRWVGLVGNYSTITNAIKMIIFGLTGPIQPMLGNFAVSKSKEETEKIMKNYGFIRFVISLFLLIPTICLSDMFVGLFYGMDYILNPVIIFLLTVDLFIVCMQGAIGELIDALGFFRQERNLYLVYAMMNVIFSCIGAKLWGIIPVFMATIVSQYVGWIWRSIIAYKYYFKSWTGFRWYWIEQVKYSIYFFINIILVYVLIRCIQFPFSYFGFILSGIFLETIIGILFLIVYRNKTEFKYFKLLVKKLIKGK